MQREQRVHVDAPPAVVWQVWSDVATWPAFIDGVRDLVIRPPRLVPGARVRIVRSGIPADEWTVVDVEPGRGWTWEARGPGVLTVATHRIEPGPGATTTAIVEVVQRGLVGTTVGWLFGPMVSRLLRRQLEGVRDRAAGRAGAGSRDA